MNQIRLDFKRLIRFYLRRFFFPQGVFFSTRHLFSSPRRFFSLCRKRKNVKSPKLSKSEEDQKKLAWTEVLDQDDAKGEIRKVDLILVILLPIIMIIFNIIYFTLTR